MRQSYIILERVIPFWLFPELSVPSDPKTPFVGTGTAECLWCFLLDEPWFPDDPVEDEKGDIKPVFLIVELKEPITASTCIILDFFGLEVDM